MNPFIYPGLKPPVSNYYVIPGFESRLIPNPNPGSVKTIYNTVMIYFNGKDHKYTSRKRDLVTIRHWTMFLSVCAGITTTIAAGFFQKDHSTAVFACKKLIGEVHVYAQQQQDFEYFYRVFRFDPKTIQSTNVKNFITSWKNRQLIKQMNQDFPGQRSLKSFEK